MLAGIKDVRGPTHQPAPLTYYSTDRYPPWKSLLRLLQGQRQHAVIELCTDLLLIDLVGESERPAEVTNVVLGVEGF